jgi:hypothetical protein
VQLLGERGFAGPWQAHHEYFHGIFIGVSHVI